MRVELPSCKRCCLCVPLRYGIIIYGYLNLVFCLSVICLQAWLDFGQPITVADVGIYHGIELLTEIWLLFALYIFEVIFNVVLLIGAHTKRPRLIRWYYYYGIMTIVAASLMFIMAIHNMYSVRGIRSIYYLSLAKCFAFASFALHAYLLLLIRTELRKLEHQSGQFMFSQVNHLSEDNLEPHFAERNNPL